MENPVRTARYLATMEKRRSDLRALLAGTLPAHARFVWEIGCGHGHFLTSYAQVHPGKLCLGIDLAAERIQRAVRKRERARLTNLHFMQADARLFLETLPAGASFSDIFVLFPDPWPKLRHHKHRIMQADFLECAIRRAAANARLYFRTDHHPYFVDVTAVLQGCPGWEPVDEAWPFEYETVFQSRAERYYSLVAKPRLGVAIGSPR